MSEQSNTQTNLAVPALTLGWRLQMALAHADLSVQGMADELGVSRSTISRWINDNGTAPRPAFVKLWALRCGVPHQWLSTGEAPQGGGPNGGPDQRLTESGWIGDRDQNVVAFPVGIETATPAPTPLPLVA